ncbi:threonylcarbamoyl-AMP synthase [bacterium]|nr:threonylcarbamoyl-AMP synthase [bacterium]
MIKEVTDIKNVAELLSNGKIGIFPFDTIWGITGIISDEVANKIHLIKKRDEKKPFLIVIPNEAYLKNYITNIPEKYHNFIKSCWPGPVTLIFNKNKNVSKIITGGLSTIGVRYPAFPVLNELLNSLKQGLISTSLNISMENHVNTIKNINPEILEKVDFIYKIEKPPSSAPSTIVDCTDSSPKISREGVNIMFIKNYIKNHF